MNVDSGPNRRRNLTSRVPKDAEFYAEQICNRVIFINFASEPKYWPFYDQLTLQNMTKKLAYTHKGGHSVHIQNIQLFSHNLEYLSQNLFRTTIINNFFHSLGSTNKNLSILYVQITFFKGGHCVHLMCICKFFHLGLNTR